jgi:hypothetical protein
MNKTQFAHDGNRVKLHFFEKVENFLSAEYYSVMKNEYGFYLEKKEPFDFPSKIYGKTDFPDRTLNTFKKLGKGMSVLLSGPKGTGKTVDAKIICKNSDMPVITVNAGFSGPNFSSFIDDLSTPCCIFIDEFEKIYFQEDDRNFFLTIMDGTSKSRHLFVLTSNSENIGEFFEGRPGRIRYHKKYDFLNDDVISEILKDRLHDQNMYDDTLKEIVKIPQLSIDSLVCIIDECNMYNEVPCKFLNFFNISYERPTYYEVTMIGKIPTPKKNLTNKQQKQDMEYQYNNWLSYPEDEYDKTLFDLVDCEFKSEFARPFSDNFIDDEQRGINPNISVNLYANGFDKPLRINWRSDDIIRFEQNRYGFEAQNKNGNIMKGIAKNKHHSYR